MPSHHVVRALLDQLINVAGVPGRSTVWRVSNGDNARALRCARLKCRYPDHSGAEEREITIGYTAGRQVVFVSHRQSGNMKKAPGGCS